MSFYITVGTSKKGLKYVALSVERHGVIKAISFDLETILFISDMTASELYGLPNGNHLLKI